MRSKLPLVGKEPQILLLHAPHHRLAEFLLASLEEGGVLIQVALHGLRSPNGVIIGQEQQDCLEVEFLGAGSSQPALHVPIAHALQNLYRPELTFIISA